MQQPVFHKIGFNPLTEQVDFVVRLGVESFEYHAGLGCYPTGKKHALMRRLEYIGAGFGTEIYRKWMDGRLKFSKNIHNKEILSVAQTIAEFVTVDADGFFYSLLSDMRASEYTFDDFCGEFGYDNDSIKALETWQACTRNGRKVRAVLNAQEIAELEKKLKDY